MLVCLIFQIFIMRQLSKEIFLVLIHHLRAFLIKGSSKNNVENNFINSFERILRLKYISLRSQALQICFKIL